MDTALTILALGILALVVGIAVGWWLHGLIPRASAAHADVTPSEPVPLPPIAMPSNDLVRFSSPEPTDSAPLHLAEYATPAVDAAPAPDPPPPTAQTTSLVAHVRAASEPAHRIVLIQHDGTHLDALVGRRAYRVFLDGHGWEHQGETADGRWTYVRTHQPGAAHLKRGVRHGLQ